MTASVSAADLLAQLIACPSPTPPGDTRAIVARIAGLLRDVGLDVSTPSRRDGAANVVARLGSGKPCLAFNAHIDTVAPGPGWNTDPYQATPRGGVVHGLGAANCKGSAASQLWLALQLAREKPALRGEVVFTFVGDEETLGPDGALYLRESGVLAPDMLVVGAPTGNQLVTEERGVMWLEITAHGRSAHAAAPHLGDNAISRMTRLLAALERGLGTALATRTEQGLGALHRSTANIGTIRGGENTNAVPEHCVATLDRRLLPTGETVEAAMAEVERLLAAAGEPAGSWSLKRLAGTNGFRARADGALVQAFGTASQSACGSAIGFIEAPGASDGRHFSDAGIDIVCFGPGDGAQGHAANECLPLAQLDEACAIQRALVGKLLGA